MTRVSKTKNKSRKQYQLSKTKTCQEINTYLVSKTLFTSAGIVSYKRLCLLYKEAGLVLVSRNSDAITFTSSLL